MTSTALPWAKISSQALWNKLKGWLSSNISSSDGKFESFTRRSRKNNLSLNTFSFSLQFNMFIFALNSDYSYQWMCHSNTLRFGWILAIQTLQADQVVVSLQKELLIVVAVRRTGWNIFHMRASGLLCWKVKLYVHFQDLHNVNWKDGDLEYDP